MSSKTKNELDNTLQIRKIYKQLSDEAVNLRVAEKILSEVESRLLKLSPSPFDIESVKTSLHVLKSLSPIVSPEDISQAEFHIKQKFDLWRGILEERDQNIETFHLRRFFDFTEEPLDGAFFVALAQFYRNTSNLSKFDLVVTRIFSRGRGQLQREVRMTRREMSNYLRDLFNGWDGKETFNNQFSDETLSAILKLEEFIREAEFVKSFEELSQSDIFVRLRNYKQELGNNFFEPSVAAAAVECNLAVGNVFNCLMAKANENLSARLTAKYDFAGAFQDISPNTQQQISEVLQELCVKENSLEENSEKDELSHILELLELGSKDNESESETEIPAEDKAEIMLPTAQERIALILLTLAEDQPDLKLLREYMQKSNSLKVLDLSDFVGSSEEYSERLCREVLSVIFLADELCENEFHQHKGLSQTTKDEVKKLVQKAQIFGEQMESLIEISDQTTQNRLLTVSNKLLETRLKLERNIVRFSKRQLGIVGEPQVITLNPIVQPVVAPSNPNMKASPWLTIATILICILCGSFYLIVGQMRGDIPLPKDVEEIEVAKLPQGDHLEIAHRQQSTLFVSAKKTWEDLSEDEKRTNLQNLLNYPAQTKLSTVVIISSKGEPLGNISNDGISLGEAE